MCTLRITQAFVLVCSVQSYLGASDQLGAFHLPERHRRGASLTCAV